MTKGVLGGVLLGAVLISTWLAWPSGQHVEPSEEGHGGVAEAAPPGRTTETAPSEIIIPGTGSLTSDRVPVPPIGAGGLELNLVKIDGRPVGSAEAWVIDSPSKEDRRTFRDLDMVDRWMEVHGTHRIADNAGKLHLAEPGDAGTLVLATHAGLWGKWSIAADAERPVEIVMKRDVTLHARVVGHTGQPVPGVIVQLAEKYPEWTLPKRSQRVDEETAMASFQHAQSTVTAIEYGSWVLGPGCRCAPE